MIQDEGSQLSAITGTRQTMASWSKIIESYDAVPEVYKKFLKPYTGNGQVFPYAILSPSLEKFLRKTTEKLTYDADDAIHILERSGNHVTARSYPYKTIYAVETGNILLSSWLTVSGVNSEGVISSSTIDFNASTGERYFSVFLNKMRPAPASVDDAVFAAEKDKFDFLAETNFKFMNYGRSSLVCGENVSQVILQPEIREPAWTFAGWTLYRTVCMAHLVILTDKELILIRDDERGKEFKGVRYGGVWQYIPLRSIRSTELVSPSQELATLFITLTSGEVLKKIFAISSLPELEQLCPKISGVTGEVSVAR